MKSKRLREQGFFNLHRKLIFRLFAIVLAAYYFYVPNLWPIADIIVFWSQITGVLFIFAGIIGRTFSALTIGGFKDRIIVKTELYSVCRNPLYFASFLMALGVGLLSGRADFAILLIILFMTLFYQMMLNEADVLRDKFEDFAAYEKRVPLFFPNVFLWQGRKEFEINFERVRRTLLDSSVILIILPIFIILRMLL